MILTDFNNPDDIYESVGKSLAQSLFMNGEKIYYNYIDTLKIPEKEKRSARPVMYVAKKEMLFKNVSTKKEMKFFIKYKRKD